MPRFTLQERLSVCSAGLSLLRQCLRWCRGRESSAPSWKKKMPTFSRPKKHTPPCAANTAGVERFSEQTYTRKPGGGIRGAFSPVRCGYGSATPAVRTRSCSLCAPRIGPATRSLQPRILIFATPLAVSYPSRPSTRYRSQTLNDRPRMSSRAKTLDQSLIPLHLNGNPAKTWPYQKIAQERGSPLSRTPASATARP
jgi:hypothetical protein